LCLIRWAVAAKAYRTRFVNCPLVAADTNN
jgi:hypothetical protein